MDIIHDFGNTGIKKKGEGNSFLLTNNIGGFAYLAPKNDTKFQGVYFYEEGECYKAIENIFIDGEISLLRNKLSYVSRNRGEVREYFFMPTGLNSFVYELSRPKEIEVVLDCRKQLDLRKWGKSYLIYQKEGVIFVKYNKKSHQHEDKNHNKKEYDIYVAIMPDKFDFQKTEKWLPTDYFFDKRRNDSNDLHTYSVLKINASRLVFGFGLTEENALKNLIETMNIKKLKQVPDLNVRFILNNEIHMAYLCSQQSLKKLYTQLNNKKGIYAGLPWFNQFWARDELISVGAFIKLKEYSFVKEILMKNLSLIQEDGRLPNRYPVREKGNELGNADGIGWLWKRFHDLLIELLSKGKIKDHFTKDELHHIKNSLEKSIHNIIKNYGEGELIKNNKMETWCDTKFSVRDGIRIEIQALQLNMYRLLYWLCSYLKEKTGKQYALHKERIMLNKVRKEFWNDHYLKDGVNDNTIRPNVFITYYVYPHLLTAQQWKKCFDNVAPRLFTGFGLTSLDKNSPDFKDRDTGIGDESYHNGNVWYWISNLAAVCLYRAGKFRYGKYIQGILTGSTKDLLWMGIPGCCSEISSAKEQEAVGCLNQAWSDAMYIEMIHEMF